ncbi:MAG: LptF/LptG family permease [Phycisphaerales bacterium]|nr:LptF/LptG family permease [Phycisphaerales bacterium]
MPGLLTRYMAGELLKTILLTTTVLVAVIAFGTAIKPLSRNLLGGSDILKYVFFAMVPMMEYALPFAAGFGSTLVLHRFAGDNEILAMNSCGLSPRRIFRPIFVLAAVLLLVMLALVEFLVPVFWSRMESLLAHDVTRLLASSVERGEAFTLGDTRIYADEVLVQDAPEGSEADTRLVLVGVAALQVDEKGRPETEFTAEYATMDLYRVDGRSILKLVLGDATVFRSGDGSLVRVPTAEPRAIDLGRGFKLGVKMLTLPEMFEVQAAPAEYPNLRSKIDWMRRLLVRAASMQHLAERLDVGGQVELRDVGRNLTWRIVSAESVMRNGGSFTLEAPVIERIGEASIRHRTRASSLVITEGWRDGLMVFDVELSMPTSTEESSISGARWPTEIRSLTLPVSDAPLFQDETPTEIVSAARALDETEIGSPALARQITKSLEGFDVAVQRLLWDIDGRMQQRLAQACTGPLLFILGSILAIRLRGSPPLTVYVIAFIPAILDIVLISGGEQSLRRGPTPAGYLLIWSGNLLLGGSCIVAWWRLQRN